MEESIACPDKLKITSVKQPFFLCCKGLLQLQFPTQIYYTD